MVSRGLLLICTFVRHMFALTGTLDIYVCWGASCLVVSLVQAALLDFA